MILIDLPLDDLFGNISLLDTLVFENRSAEHRVRFDSSDELSKSEQTSLISGLRIRLRVGKSSNFMVFTISLHDSCLSRCEH